MFLLKKLFCFVACFMMIKWTFLESAYILIKLIGTACARKEDI